MQAIVKRYVFYANALNIVIESSDHPLLVKMDKFWASSGIQEQLQMFFINCLCKTYKDDKPIYLGGSTPDDLTGYIRIIGEISSSCRALKCDHGEGDKGILFQCHSN